MGSILLGLHIHLLPNETLLLVVQLPNPNQYLHGMLLYLQNPREPKFKEWISGRHVFFALC